MESNSWGTGFVDFYYPFKVFEWCSIADSKIDLYNMSDKNGIQYPKLDTVGNVLPVTRWLILSSAYKSWQSMMVSHRAVDQLHSLDSSINMSHPDHVDWWVSTVKLINVCMGYHNGLSGLICRALSQPPSYKETSSFQSKLLHPLLMWGVNII